MIQLAEFDKLACEIFPHLNFFVVKSCLKVSYEDIINHVGIVMRDSNFRVGMSGLYDFTELYHLTGNPDALRQTAAAMNDRSVIDRPAKTAILVANDSYEVHDMFDDYIAMTKSSFIEYRMFLQTERKQMLEFLGIDEIPLFSI